MPMVLQAHVEGSSLRGISRTVNLAYNTVQQSKIRKKSLCWVSLRSTQPTFLGVSVYYSNRNISLVVSSQ